VSSCLAGRVSATHTTLTDVVFARAAAIVADAVAIAAADAAAFVLQLQRTEIL
jgi:hypothetical protein